VIQSSLEAFVLKIFFGMPFTLNLCRTVFERMIRYSFAYMMQTAQDIDYKELYENSQLALESVKLQLAQLKKMIFGSKHERFVATDANNPGTQLTLELDAETIAACKVTAATKITYVRTSVAMIPKAPKPHPGRMKIPENFRREVIVLQPDCDITGLKKIGEEITEILNYTPGEFYVKQYIRPKYLLPVSATSDTVITASLPGRMMEKCMAAENLVAQILVDKYMDHLPLHRQLQRFERAGLVIAQSTINGWAKNGIDPLVGLYELQKQVILNSGYINADETGIRVLDDDKKGKTHKGFYWVYHSQELKASLFDYQPGRGRDGPGNLLEKYQGYLQTDGYNVYDEFASKKGITHLLCMAHARRYFIDALDSNRPLAEHALKMFQQLYAIEARIKSTGLTGEDVLRLRQTESMPLLQAMKQWMTEQYVKLLPGSPICKAIAYSLPRWDKLSIYTTDARLNIDNNPVENAIRPVAIGRKNYLFAGSHEAAQRAAMIYSFFNTCRLHKINPYEWLKDVLENIHRCTSSNLHELLPQNWAKNKNPDMG
jgi:transposase